MINCMLSVGYRVWGMGYGQAKILVLLLLCGIAGAQTDTALTDTTLSDADYFYIKYISETEATQQKLLDSSKAVIKAEKSKPPVENADKKPDLEKLSYEDLFRAAFKTDIVRAHYFMVRFFADGKSMGNAEISYDSAFTSFVFSSMPFSNYLDFILLPDERQKIKDSEGFFNSEELKELGFEVRMDERAYELHIHLPPNIKSLQTLSLDRTYVPKGTLVKPASFSFFLNLYASESYYINTRENYSANENNVSNNYYRNPFLADMDAAMAAFGWALEGSGNFREVINEDISSNNFKRGDLRLVRDIYSLNSRLTFGDVSEVAGLRYEHSSRMFSRDRLADKHKINFFLPRASYIEIHIDGKMIRREFMPSGYHEISGFSGSTGINKVQVFIHHADGTIEEVNYQFELGDGRTMTKGETRYYLNAGIRRTAVQRISSYKYHPNEPGLDAEYKYGLFHSLSTGYVWRISQKNILAGLQIYNTNPLGYTELHGFINSADSSSQVGKRAELNHYIDIRPPINYLENASLSIYGYIQDSKYNPNLFTLLYGKSSDFAGIYSSFSTSFLQSYLSINAGFTFNRKSETQETINYNYGIMASKNLFGFSLSTSASSTISNNTTAYYFSANAAYTFGIQKHRLRFSGGLSGNTYSTDAQYVENPYYGTDYGYEYSEYENSEYYEIPGSSSYNLYKNAALGWSWSDGGGNTGGQSYSANVSIRDKVDNLNANLNGRYNFNRMQLNGRYSFSHYETSVARSRINAASINASTSLMFADGLWAFGRPVQNGFILADADKSLAGSTVRINYSQGYDKDLSHSGTFGAAYQNSIANYSPTSINIRLNNVPPGAFLEQNQFYVMGAYKHGYAVKLGNEMRVFLQVRLNDERGHLSNYYTGILELDKDGNTVSKRITFTSKDGILQMGNLMPGKKYRINFDQSTYIKDIDIEIPSDSEPFLELPDITVER